MCRQGEIDIIATNGGYIVFIEVKTRSNLSFGKPSEAVTEEKIKHMYNTAKYYLYKNKVEESLIRFDVIEIYINKKEYRINHIKQII